MLPNGWILCKIKDIQTVEVQNGFSPLCVEEPTDRKSLSLGALTGDSLDLNQQKSISVKAVMPSHSLLRKNDILVSRSNTKDKVGRAGLVQSDVEKIYYPDLMMRFQVDAKKADCRFVTLCLQSPAGRRYFECSAAGTSLSMVKINKNILESFPIMLPPLSEQKKIAETLSVWDRAIEKTEKLIEAKEDNHAALMTEVLDPCDTWNQNSLSSLAFIKKGSQLNGVDMIMDGQYYVMNGGITPSGNTNDWNTPENTISISEGGNSCGFVAFNKEKFWAGGHCYTIIDLDKFVSTRFLFHFLKKMEKQIMAMRVGSGLPNIQKDSISNIVIKYPSKKDQEKISSLLDASLEEIDLLKQQLDNYKKQKQGLMQKILTGQWRVK
jgi:type I restriction enzyme S subunit